MRNINSRKLHAGLVALAAFSSVLVTGCTSEGIVDAPDKVPLTLTATIEGASTRSVSSTLHETTFEAGAGIVVNISEAGNLNGDLYSYTANPGGVMQGSASIYLSSSTPDQTMNIYAWYPSNPLGSVYSTPTFTVLSDQSTDANYNKSDLMTAFATANYYNPSPTLKFIHKLTKIVANIECSVNGVDKSAEVKVEIMDVYTSAETSNNQGNQVYTIIETGAPFAAVTSGNNATQSDIIMKDPEAGNASTSVAAIIPPQTIAAGTKFFRVTIDGTEYTAALDETKDYTFEPGYEYIFTITLGSAKVSVTRYEINSWGAGNYTDEDRTGESIGL